MLDEIERFFALFHECATTAAKAKFCSTTAYAKLFNGTAYSQRRTDWFPREDAYAPRRTIQPHDFEILKLCMASAKDFRGAGGVDVRQLAELDRRYRAYLIAMRSLDSRRSDVLVGRPMSVKAARAKIDQMANSHGCDVRHLGDKDCFAHVLENERIRNNKNGAIHRGFRVAEALCTLLAGEPDWLTRSEDLQFAYFVKAAASGWWTAWQIGGDLNARRHFLRIMQRLDRCNKEVVCHSIFAADCLSDERWEEAAFTEFIEAGKAKPSLARSLFLGPASGYLTEVGLWTLKAGQPLRSPSARFEGKTPEQVMIGAIEDRIAYFRKGRVAAFLHLFHSYILAHGGYPDEAWATLAEAERYWENLHEEDAHWRLCKAECRAEIHRAEWLLDRTPKTLVDYATHVERAASNAEHLNLPLRAEQVRRRLNESLSVYQSNPPLLA